MKAVFCEHETMSLGRGLNAPSGHAQAELEVACTAVGLAERALLYVLGFELNVMHPFKPLQAIMEAQRLVRNAPFHPPTGMSMVPQLAWDFMNCRRGS